jgi:oxygen-independent coproporphyrinogen-3 oxidase
VFEALSGAARAGFSNIGLDLMYALPNESLEGWQADLDAALALQVPHLSCYMLTLEPGTPFYRQYENGCFNPCDPDRRSDFFVHTSRVLEQAGDAHYEVSNFARNPWFRSIHNTHYWERGPYLGVGPSAHSFLTRMPEIHSSLAVNPQGVSSFPESGKPIRFWNPSSIHAWLDQLAAGRLTGAGHEILRPDQEMMERIMLGLRTDQGIVLDGLNEKTRIRVDQLATQRFGTFFHHGHMEDGIRRFRLTRTGLSCLDSIVDALVP